MRDEAQARRYLIPIWGLDRGKAERFRQNVIEYLTKCYIRRHVRPSPMIRQLLASDLGLQTWRTPSQSPGEKSVWVNYEVPLTKCLIIMGITQLSENPKVSKVTIGLGVYAARIIGLHELDELYAALPMLKVLKKSQEGKPFSKIADLEYLKMTGFFSEPYIYEEQEIVHISVESPEGSKIGDKLMLNGFIAEQQGREIS